MQNPWLLDNLVAEDRHEIGCESLESHFHKDWHKAGGTNKGLIFATSDSTAIVTIYVLSPVISTSSPSTSPSTHSLSSSPCMVVIFVIVVKERSSPLFITSTMLSVLNYINISHLHDLHTRMKERERYRESAAV